MDLDRHGMTGIVGDWKARRGPGILSELPDHRDPFRGRGGTAQIIRRLFAELKHPDRPGFASRGSGCCIVTHAPILAQRGLPVSWQYHAACLADGSTANHPRLPGSSRSCTRNGFASCAAEKRSARHLSP